MRRILPALVLVLALGLPAWAATSHLMRYADVHGEQIVFTYEGDLWLVAASGGSAQRLTRHEGLERYAKFSPDGSKIAFTGEYDGGRDVYVMDAKGSEPRRLTYHPSSDKVLGWTPAGDAVLFRSRREYPFRGEEVYTVSVEGGMPVELPVDRAGLASLSPDGKSIAYNRISREDRTWKRHQGGTAQEIWVGTLGKGDFHTITDWPGTDNYPMWHASGIYFTSDRAHGTMNLYRYDVGTGTTEALTDYDEYDVKYPSLGPNKIVFQNAESLFLLDLATKQVKPVPVQIHSDRVPVRAEYVSAGSHTGGFRLSPEGDRLLLEARGEVLSVPVEEDAGEVINLTGKSGSREKDPIWSPDGKSVALISDATGAEELYLVDPEGRKPWRQITHDGSGFRMQPVWSPDSRYLLYSDKTMRLNLLDVTAGKVTLVDQGEYDDAWERWGIQDYVFSPDSRFVAYSKMERTMNEALFLYSIDGGKRTRLTGEMTEDWSPSFDPEGRYLYFLSQRTFSPIMGRVDQNHVFLNLTRPYMVLLKAGEPSPFGPSKAGEKPEKDKGAAKKGEDGDKPITIDLQGIAKRIVAVEGVPAGNYFRLEATSKGLLYLAKGEPEFLKYQTVDDHTGGRLDLYSYCLEKKKSKKVLPGIANYHLSPDGKKLVYKAGSRFGVVDAGAEAKAGDGEVSLDGVKFKIEREAELNQIFDEAWRVQRDWFYDAHLHGVDWKKVGEKYRRFIPDCGNRADVNYLIGEMIGELNIGHTYIFGGDLGSGVERIPLGLLGAVFEQPQGAAHHRIAHIIPGTSWDPRDRSPLTEPGCAAREGDYLISIDGQGVDIGDNVYAFLENKVGHTVELTLSADDQGKQTKTCRVEPLGSERSIRYREWVEHNRALVDRLSGGKIGYVHLPNMMQDGLIEFAKAYYPQYYKKAIIIDERYNTGGFVGDMIIDRLERELWSMTQPREGKPLPDPERTLYGYLAVLINEDTGSNGEYFAEAIKIKKLAPLIGMRTWGGAVGIEPHQRLVDGGTTTPPQFAPYWKQGWLIEGHGVDPDVEVQNMPGEVLAGKDSQLEAAVGLLLKQIEEHPKQWPPRPPYPDKSKPADAASRK